MPKMTIPRRLLPLVQKPKRFKIIIGGRGCVSADTLISTASGPARIDEFNGGLVHAITDRGVEQVYAGPSICYPPAQLYKVTLSSGKQIECTIEHRFMTSYGWLSLEHVVEKQLPICVSGLLPTTLGSDLLKSGEDVLHCLRKLLGLLYRYYEYYHQCGRQPHQQSDTYLSVAQRLIGGLQRNCHALMLEDDSEFWRTHNFSLFLHLLSSLSAALLREVQSYAESENCNSGIFFEQILQILLETQQSHEKTSPRQLILKLSKFVQHFALWQKFEGGILQTVSDMLQLDIGDNSYSNSLGCNGGRHYESVVSSVATASAEYYDLFVPLYNNYLTHNGIVNHNSGKSQTVGDICLMDAQTKGIKTGCFREFQVTMDDSVQSLLSAEIERLGLQGFKTQSTSIQYQGQDAFKFRGLARNPEGIKSMHGFQRFWVEEAQTISFESLKALTPTLRTEESEIWMTGNPRHSSDVFSQRFIKPWEKELRRDKYYEDDLHLVIWVNHDDNPFFPQVLEQERAHDQASLSSALYRHIWLGEYYDEVEDCIIPVEWFDAAIDAHQKLGFKPEGAIVASHDPSDEGGDTKGLVIRRGSVVLQVGEMVTGDSNEGMDWALEEARKAGADWFVWDCDGMGISLKRQVETALTGTKMQWWMFKGSETPDDPDAPYASGKEQQRTNRDTFFNKRAQYWWKLRERFEATWRAVEQKKYTNPDEMISLSSEIATLDQLRAEVCRIPLKRNNNGKIQIMSKLEMAKKPYQLPSPNMGDSLMMSMFSPKLKAQVQQIKFAGWGR